MLDAGAGVNQRNSDGVTALMHSAVLSHVEVVKQLLEGGADLRAVDNDGFDALVAAATGGFALWNWPKPRGSFGPAGVLGAGAILLALGSQFALYSDIPKLALALLLPVLLADRLADRIVAPDGRLGWLLAPAVLAVIAMIPVAAAVAIVLLQSDGDYPY